MLGLIQNHHKPKAVHDLNFKAKNNNDNQPLSIFRPRSIGPFWGTKHVCPQETATGAELIHFPDNISRFRNWLREKPPLGFTGIGCRLQNDLQEKKQYWHPASHALATLIFIVDLLQFAHICCLNPAQTNDLLSWTSFYLKHTRKTPRVAWPLPWCEDKEH